MLLTGFYFVADAVVLLYLSAFPYWGETAFSDKKEVKCKEDQPVQRGVWNAGRIPAGSRPLRPAQIEWGDRSAGIHFSPGSAWRPGAWCHVKILVTHVRIKSGVRSSREHAGGPTDCQPESLFPLLVHKSKSHHTALDHSVSRFFYFRLSH